MGINLLSRLYRRVVYTVQDITWRFKAKDPREDQAEYNLRGLTSPVFVNQYLDAQPIPIEGRFPQILRNHPTLANRIVSDATRLSYSSNDPLSRILSPEEKEEYIALLTVAETLKHKS